MGRGPVQILVVGFSDDTFAEQVLPELLRLRERDVVRVIDLSFVTKDEAGNLTRLDVSALAASESERFGAVVAALIGSGPLGAEGISVGVGAGVGGACAGAPAGETWAISDAIPPGASAAVVLIEHRWAIPLRAAVRSAGGFALEDTWVFPADLAAVGAAGATTGWRWDGDPDG
jgi:uncharacterized membrane protein